MWRSGPRDLTPGLPIVDPFPQPLKSPLPPPPPQVLEFLKGTKALTPCRLELPEEAWGGGGGEGSNVIH